MCYDVFHECLDSKLQQKAVLDLHFKKNKSDARKITGFQVIKIN